MKNNKQFYKELGRLVYAVASADGTVQEEERLKLQELVVKELAGSEDDSDSSGMNMAFYVNFEFENSEKEKPEMYAVLRSFNAFIQANHEAGDGPLLKRSVNLLENVANAYNHRREKDIISAVRNKVHEFSIT